MGRLCREKRTEYGYLKFQNNGHFCDVTNRTFVVGLVLNLLFEDVREDWGEKRMGYGNLKITVKSVTSQAENQTLLQIFSLKTGGKTG